MKDLMRRKEEVELTGPHSLGDASCVESGSENVQCALQQNPRQAKRFVEPMISLRDETMEDWNNGGGSHADKEAGPDDSVLRADE
jgi:hypothetical protein